MTADWKDIKIIAMNEDLSQVVDINSGSAPARIVLILSDSPSEEWLHRFNNDPDISKYTTGGAKIFVTSNRLEVNCDPEQFEETLLPTTKKVILKSNVAYRRWLEKRQRDIADKEAKEVGIKAKLAELKNKLKFDN